MLDIFWEIMHEDFRIPNCYSDDFTDTFWIDCLFFCTNVKYSNLPFDCRTDEFFEKAKKVHPTIVCKFPKDMSTVQEIKEALRIDGLMLQYITEPIESFYEIACRQNGKALAFVPKCHQTIELQKLAIMSDPEALLYIKHKNRNEELFTLAAREVEKRLPYVSEELLNIISKNYFTVPIPKRKNLSQTHEKIVQSNISRIYKENETQSNFYDDYQDYFDEDNCKNLIEDNFDDITFENVPTNYFTAEFWKRYIKNYKKAKIENVPKEFLNDELRVLSFEKNELTKFDVLPKDKISKKYCLKIFINTFRLHKIPFEFMTQKHVELALENTFNQIVYLYENEDKLPQIDFQNLTNYIITINKNALRYISEKYVTLERIEMAVQEFPCAVIHVLHRKNVVSNEKLLSLLELACKKNGNVLQHVPNALMTTEMCCNAIKSKPLSIIYIPKDKINKEILHTFHEVNIIEKLIFYDEDGNEFVDELIIDIATLNKIIRLVPPKYIPEYIVLEILYRSNFGRKMDGFTKVLDLNFFSNGESISYATAFSFARTIKHCKFIVCNSKKFPKIDIVAFAEEKCKKFGKLLKFVPDCFKTRTMCLNAVQACLESILYVDLKNLDDKICKIAANKFREKKKGCKITKQKLKEIENFLCKYL